MGLAAPAGGTKPTRDLILDATLAAFADRGVEATSLDSVAATVGIRKQTILYWFPSKEQLLLGVVDHAVADIGARLARAAAEARPRRVGAERPEPPRSDTRMVHQRARVVSEAGSVRADDQVVHERARVVSEPTVDLADRLTAVVDAVFRLGTTHPELLAVMREVARFGLPATTRLAAGIEPMLVAAVSALPSDVDAERVRVALLAAGARVIGLATEAEIRADLGLAPDLAWLRTHRRGLIDALLADLT